MFYDATYLVDGYTLADAFRPQPGWGKRVTRVDAASLPPHTDSELIEAARMGTPPGYWLQRIEAYGGEPNQRTVFVKQVPWNQNKVAAEAAAESASV